MIVAKVEGESVVVRRRFQNPFGSFVEAQEDRSRSSRSANAGPVCVCPPFYPERESKYNIIINGPKSLRYITRGKSAEGAGSFDVGHFGFDPKTENFSTPFPFMYDCGSNSFNLEMRR